MSLFKRLVNAELPMWVLDIVPFPARLLFEEEQKVTRLRNALEGAITRAEMHCGRRNCDICQSWIEEARDVLKETKP